MNQVKIHRAKPLAGTNLLSRPTVKIAILLATYNGAEFLLKQLESIRGQTYANWELFASDDGSIDETCGILEQFAASVPQCVSILKGPRLGFWRNFVSLVRIEAIDAELFAYCDQDDIWFPEKLSKAASWFASQLPEQPALYFTRTSLIAEDETPIGMSPLFVRAPTFRNALVQNIGGGNTMVFNRSACVVLRRTPFDAAIVSHDWWTYQIIAGVGGTCHYDAWPSVLYRQHGRNLVGGNIGVRARISRLSAFAGGRVVTWNDINLALLDRMKTLLTAENADVLDRYRRAREASLPMRIWLFIRSGVYRQSWLENVGLAVGVLLRRI